MTTFVVGEKVVYPNQGVGTIENISTRYFEQKPERFYLLRLFCSSMTVMVPFANAESIGLRKISKATDVSKVLAYLSGPSVEALQDWKIRFKINSDKMLSGSLLQIAEVFKQLVRLQADKPLSFREKKMLDRARTMLISEVSQARNISQPEAINLMQKSLSRRGLNPSSRFHTPSKRKAERAHQAAPLFYFPISVPVSLVGGLSTRNAF